MNDEKTLEQAFTELEELTAKMEKEGLSLEETFKLYKEGLDLVELCNKKIEKVETEIRVLNGTGEEHE